MYKFLTLALLSSALLFGGDKKASPNADAVKHSATREELFPTRPFGASDRQMRGSVRPIGRPRHRLTYSSRKTDF